jgi:hypothetical protein
VVLNWTNLTFLKGRLGISTCTDDATLVQILAGVETTIQNAIRSPVKLKLIADEWRAPVDDYRLLLKWRPVNVLNVPAGTADPVVLSCEQPYATSAGTPLTYGTDFLVYDLDQDGRFGLAPMLEAINGPWSVWCGRWSRPPTRLANTRQADRGRLKVTYWAGWPADAIPPVLADAAYLEAAAQWQIRKYGRILSSESLNGYSYQTAAIMAPPTWASARFVSPFVAGMLSEYIMPAVAGAGPW